MNLTIGTDGTIRFIYSDELASIIEQGEARITRASHVEPHDYGGWYADMRPSGGPVLMANGHAFWLRDDLDAASYIDGIAPGFATRAEALAAEVKWLEENRGL